jgi:hypothetical protein
MTDEQLRSSWPDLGTVVADRLVDAVQYSSTSGESYCGVGNLLFENRSRRKKLSPPGVRAWQRVMANRKT